MKTPRPGRTARFSNGIGVSGWSLINIPNSNFIVHDWVISQFNTGSPDVNSVSGIFSNYLSERLYAL